MQVKDEEDDHDGQLEIAHDNSTSSATKAQRDDQFPEVVVEEEADNENDFEGLEEEFQGIGGAAAGGDIIGVPEGDLQVLPGSFVEPGVQVEYQDS